MIMTQIMGTAVLAPPELAIGAAVAKATARLTPRTAEAAPATCADRLPRVRWRCRR